MQNGPNPRNCIAFLLYDRPAKAGETEVHLPISGTYSCSAQPTGSLDLGRGYLSLRAAETLLATSLRLRHAAHRSLRRDLLIYHLGTVTAQATLEVKLASCKWDDFPAADTFVVLGVCRQIPFPLGGGYFSHGPSRNRILLWFLGALCDFCVSKLLTTKFAEVFDATYRFTASTRFFTSAANAASFSDSRLISTLASAPWMAA
jgi:hypothetical protein